VKGKDTVHFPAHGCWQVGFASVQPAPNACDMSAVGAVVGGPLLPTACLVTFDPAVLITTWLLCSLPGPATIFPSLLLAVAVFRSKLTRVAPQSLMAV
jgi:hypothetical protein